MEKLDDLQVVLAGYIRIILSSTNLTPANICQAFYIISSAAVIGVSSLPAIPRAALFDYGPRRPGEVSSSERKSTKPLIARITDATNVPHSWFLHFYILSTSLSVFWIWQYLTEGPILREIAMAQVKGDGDAKGMEISQVFLTAGLMALQGARRLYESLVVVKQGKSPMGGLIWFVALLYYTAMSISVWIEGSGAILASWEAKQLKIHVPVRSPVVVALFFMGWIKQNECHRYLASLKKYTLPNEGYFKNVVCAHYMFELVIYTSLALMSAPAGSIFSRTVFYGLIFVAINLGATANSTKKWYAEKFGHEKVAKKAKMIPFIY